MDLRWPLFFEGGDHQFLLRHVWGWLSKGAPHVLPGWGDYPTDLTLAPERMPSSLHTYTTTRHWSYLASFPPRIILTALETLPKMQAQWCIKMLAMVPCEL